MELVLIIKNKSYINPYSIRRGSSVAWTLSEALEPLPLHPGQTFRKSPYKPELIVSEDLT